jgi:hypothetical protein
MTIAYDEFVDFIAAGTTPSGVVAFQPSDATKERVEGLIRREKTSALSDEETAELNHYFHIEHVMRLAKARARRLLPRE